MKGVVKMLEKLSLSQFEAKDFNGYPEIMQREYNENNRFGLVEIICGLNIFFMIMSLLFYYIESGVLLLLLISIIYLSVTLCSLPLLYFTKLKKSVVFQYINLGIQFLFFSLLNFVFSKYLLLNNVQRPYYIPDEHQVWLEIIFLIFLLISAFLGYVFYVGQIKKGTYRKNSSYIKYVKKNTSTDLAGKYKHIKVWLFAGILLAPSIPAAFFFLDKVFLTLMGMILVSYAVIFITPILFISAYFLKKFPEIYQETGKKNKRKPNPKAKAR